MKTSAHTATARRTPAARRPRNPRRPRRVTLRTRLTLVYGALFLAAGVVLLGVTYALFDQQLGREGGELSVHSESGGGGASYRTSPSSGPEDSGPRTAESWIKDEQQRLHDAAATSLVTQGGIALAVVGVVAASFGWLVAGRVLAPLHRVTDTARRIAAAPAADRHLHERIQSGGPDDEVKDLADAFDTMIERLDRSFDGQRRFVANASHELRTPLTVGRALVEMAMHRRSASADVKQLGESLLEINIRHERLISGLLLLAGSENHLPERHPVDLADVAAHVLSQTSREAGGAGVTTHADNGPAPTRGDVILLERVVQNLVENGIRHNTGPGGWVRVGTRTTDGGTVQVEVSNSGPHVPPYEVPTLFEPFHRLGTERLVTAKGAGLGLSIVRAVARAHDGTVTARARAEGGLTVTVSLPHSPDEETDGDGDGDGGGGGSAAGSAPASAGG